MFLLSALLSVTLAHSFRISVFEVTMAGLVQNHAVYARAVLRKTLTDVVLTLNAIAAKSVAVGSGLSPLYSAHLGHFDKSTSLRGKPLRRSPAPPSDRNFWFFHALDRDQTH